MSLSSVYPITTTMTFTIDYSTCEEVQSLDDTERGDKGFGSSDK